MSQNRLLTPSDAEPLLADIIPAYQTAFAGPPWYEVSKCPDPLQRCPRGLSALAIGATCDVCELRPMQPAYESDELIARFKALGESRPAAWYVEQDDNGSIALAAFGWLANTTTIVEEKYAGTPEFQRWLNGRLEGNILWLDEVFADRTVRPSGNLANFGTFVRGMATQLGVTTIAYRTIEPRMTAVATRDFREAATVFAANTEVPDERDFIIITIEEEQS